MSGLLDLHWLDELWGLWYFGLCAAVLLLAGISCCWSWLAQVVDWRWDRGPESVYAKKNAERTKKGLPSIKVNWFRARAQQNAGLRLGYPLGLLGIAAMAYTWHMSYQGNHGMNMGVYGVFAILWFVSTPLRYIWRIKISYRLNRLWVNDLRKLGMVEESNWIPTSDQPYASTRTRVFSGSASKVIRQHFRWAIATHRGNERVKKEYFYVHLTWLNPVINFVLDGLKLRFLGCFSLVVPIAAYGLASFVWPVALVFSVFFNGFEASEQNVALSARPWWRSSRSEPNVAA